MRQNLLVLLGSAHIDSVVSPRGIFCIVIDLLQKRELASLNSNPCSASQARGDALAGSQCHIRSLQLAAGSQAHLWCPPGCRPSLALQTLAIVYRTESQRHDLI